MAAPGPSAAETGIPFRIKRPNTSSGPVLAYQGSGYETRSKATVAYIWVLCYVTFLGSFNVSQGPVGAKKSALIKGYLNPPHYSIFAIPPLIAQLLTQHTGMDAVWHSLMWAVNIGPIKIPFKTWKSCTISPLPSLFSSLKISGPRNRVASNVP